MKLKGLAEVIKATYALQDTVNEMIDNHDEEKDPAMQMSEMFNEAYFDLDTAIEALNDIKKLSKEDF